MSVKMRTVILIFVMTVISSVQTFAQDRIEIVILAPLTGQMSNLGKQWRNGIKIAVKQLNDGRQVSDPEIFAMEADSSCDPKQATKEANKIVRSGNPMLVLHMNCGESKFATMPIFQESEIPHIVYSHSIPGEKRYSHSFEGTIISEEKNNFENISTLLKQQSHNIGLENTAGFVSVEILKQALDKVCPAKPPLSYLCPGTIERSHLMDALKITEFSTSAGKIKFLEPNNGLLQYPGAFDFELLARCPKSGACPQSILRLIEANKETLQQKMDATS